MENSRLRKKEMRGWANLRVEVQAHYTTGGVAQELRVGGVLQGEDADHPRLSLLVEIICNQ